MKAVFVLLLLPKEVVFVFFCFVGWFVSRTTQKLWNRFASNLDGGWVISQNRPH